MATGPAEFIQTLNEHWPVGETERVPQFLGTMDDDGVEIGLNTWPGRLLRNVYGDGKAQDFIEAANW